LLAWLVNGYGAGEVEEDSPAMVRPQFQDPVRSGVTCQQSGTVPSWHGSTAVILSNQRNSELTASSIPYLLSASERNHLGRIDIAQQQCSLSHAHIHSRRSETPAQACYGPNAALWRAQKPQKAAIDRDTQREPRIFPRSRVRNDDRHAFDWCSTPGVHQGNALIGSSWVVRRRHHLPFDLRFIDDQVHRRR
jgi:hypothetical protein